MSEAIVVREWDADRFHDRILKLGSEGYTARMDSYHVVPEMNPETGEVIHLRTIEMFLPATEDR